MNLNQGFIAEIKHEAASTRKMLEHVPLDKGDYKPHEKSMTLSRLAVHVAELPGWIGMAMGADELDLAAMNYKPAQPTTTAELLAVLDKNVEIAVAALENSTNEDFGKMWTLRHGENVHFSIPKAAVVRSFALSHLYHHRGQLSVYLRMLDAYVPGMYGPSKSDSEMMQAAAK